MKRGILAAITAGALVACGGDGNAIDDLGTDQAAIYYCPDEVRTNWGGQTIDTGTVSLSNDETNLYITISGENGWLVDEWHVYAGTGPVPVNGGGSPAPGRFPYQGEPDAPQSELVIEIPLSSLGVGCDTALNVAVHSVMRKTTSGGTQEETAWADWETEFGGSRWGGSFGYTICCNEDQPQTNPNGPCVKAAHYFAQMPHEWPASIQSLSLGSTSYTKAELLAILALDWTEDHDISIYLAHQVIAALLNEARGATLSAAAQTSLVEAAAWFDANEDADGFVPYGIHKDTDPSGLAAQSIKDALMEFNTGGGGYPACN